MPMLNEVNLVLAPVDAKIKNKKNKKIKKNKKQIKTKSHY
jgi:hypothetical protein